MSSNFYQELVESIMKAQAEAIKEGIKVNTIFLNEDYDKCKEFMSAMSQLKFSEEHGYPFIATFPPMLLGKKMILANFLPSEYPYALGETNMQSVQDYIAALEHKLELFKKYVLIQGEGDNEHLAFKGISPKKNAKDYEEIKEIL